MKTSINNQSEVFSDPFVIINIKLNNLDSIEIIQLLLEKNIAFVVTNEKVKQPSPHSNVAKSSVDKEYLIQLIYQKYIVDGIEMVPPNINEIANEIGMSLSQFTTRFEAMYGNTFYQTYVNKKMEYASFLLKKGLSSSIISERIGYSHPIKFNKMFQKHFGTTPKKFQSANFKVMSLDEL